MPYEKICPVIHRSSPEDRKDIEVRKVDLDSEYGKQLVAQILDEEKKRSKKPVKKSPVTKFNFNGWRKKK